MAGITKEVWKFIGSYKNYQATRDDIMGAMQKYRGLCPTINLYVFNDGTEMNLVKLSGTIPVLYKRVYYNIPVAIWLINTHPDNAPICYVEPTPDMRIQMSQYVDHNGKIYLPYLHNWTPNSSSLEGLIDIMVVTFGNQPPVFSKSPNGLTPRSEIPSSVGQFQQGLPYPTVPAGGYSSGTSYNLPYPTQPTSNFAPYPTYSNYPPYPTTNVTPYPSNPFSSNNENQGTGTITEEHIRASLLSAVEDKLKRRLREQFSQNQAELDTLKRTQQELHVGTTRIDDILKRLDNEQSELDKNIKILQEKENELTKAIEKLNNEESIDVDEAVTTTAPLYKQLLNAYAEESAIEDAIYYMGEALRRDVIDLEVFLKQVRTLSRKQFMLRALMQKCRQKAGLAG